MERKRKLFRKEHGIAKRVFSFLLAFAMVVTMGAFSQLGGIVSVKADTGVKLYFELPAGTSATDWVVNAWTDVTVEGDTDNAFRPSTWGDGDTYPALLTDSNLSGWGYVTISGTVQGLQFVSASGTEYNCWNSQIANKGLTEAYYSPSDGKWYEDSAKATEITEAAIRNIFVLAGATELTGANWSLTETSGFLTQSETDANKYSVTFKNVAAGTYQYKILQDPENKSWDLPWGSGSADGGNRSVTVSELSDVTFTIDLTDTSVETVDGGVTVTITPSASTVVSPEVNGSEVTFRYESASATSVQLAGSMTEWQAGAVDMTKGSDDVWSVTIELEPGTHTYKYIVDGSNWVTDPFNTNGLAGDGNSQVFVPGLADGKAEVVKGEAASLPETLKLYGADGSSTDEQVTYTLATAAAASYVTINGTTITVDSGYTGTSLELTAADGNGNTSTVTVSLVDTLYTYTIYYYDWTESHMGTDAAALWIWQNGGAGGVEYPFTATEEIDGYTWLKAEVELSYYDNICVKPKIKSADPSSPTWEWEGSEKDFSNSSKSEAMTVYLVSNKTTAYTTAPDLSALAPRERNVVVEYVPTSTYNDWNIYSWNTGLSSETEIYAELTSSGKYYMTVPIDDFDADLQLSFCMRQCSSRGANDWAAKDGGDYYLDVPANQIVVKAVFKEGEGITEVLPYNTGYEMDGDNDRIYFYYRDDSLFLTDELDSLAGKVSVEINGTTYPMSYDEVNERYYYEYTGLASGDYRYRYVVDGEYLLDSFNADKTTESGTEYSVVTYKEYDALGIKASLLNASMDYNDNNVLYVDFTGASAGEISTEEIRSIVADLSALGVGSLEINPELMAGTIACLYSTSTGVKTIPVTLTDVYGHTYTASVSVTITERDKSDGDFDWDEAIIYFAVTDRFFDGNTGNNTGVDKDGSLSYHGGDFAGLNQKLDYLADLGVNTIWITPIVENSDTTTEKDGKTIESTGYHGYWASDFTALNSHLGTEAEFAALIAAAHERGMKIMVDVVINHAGYGTEDYFNTIIQDANGNYVSMIRDSSNTVSGSDIYASLSGLPDFVTEDAAVRDQLVEWQTEWMSKFDIDYYRVDTVKHVDATTWAAFKNSLTEANPEFKMTGEYSGAGYASTTGELGTGRMDALLDFDYNGWAADFLTGSISSVESSLVSRNAAINNTATTSQFINSHDEDGLLYTLQNEKGLTEAEAYALIKVAASLTITAKGQPVIYYGEEIGQYGQNNYPYQTNRYDFDWDELAAQMADSSSIYNHYKTMLGIRNDYSELFARGDRVTIETSDSYDVFSRSYDGTTLYIGMNIGSAEKTVSIKVDGAAGTAYVDLYSGASYTVSSSGTISVTIPAAADGGTVVLKEEENGTISTEATANDGYTVAVTGVSAAVLKEIVYNAATDQELIRLQAGMSALLYLNVSDITGTVSQTEKDLVKSVVPNGFTIGSYLDLDCFIQYGRSASQKYELSSEITVSVTLPAKLINTDSSKTRTYKVVRIHDGAADLLNADFDASTGKLSFKTDRFSTYAIIYQDTTANTSGNGSNGTTANTSPSVSQTTSAVETGDTAPYAGYVLIVLFGGVLLAYAVRRKIGMVR